MNFCDCSAHPPCKPWDAYSYAQYGVQANPPSGSDLPMFILFQEGNQIALSNNQIILKSGYLYLIDYIFSATTEMNSYMQIAPKINGVPNLLYSFFAPSGTLARNVSASGSFTTNTASDNDASIVFHLTYPETVRNIDISGAISVTALKKINDNKCNG